MLQMTGVLTVLSASLEFISSADMTIESFQIFNTIQIYYQKHFSS